MQRHTCSPWLAVKAAGASLTLIALSGCVTAPPPCYGELPLGRIVEVEPARFIPDEDLTPTARGETVGYVADGRTGDAQYRILGRAGAPYAPPPAGPADPNQPSALYRVQLGDGRIVNAVEPARADYLPGDAVCVSPIR